VGVSVYVRVCVWATAGKGRQSRNHDKHALTNQKQLAWRKRPKYLEMGVEWEKSSSSNDKKKNAINKKNTSVKGVDADDYTSLRPGNND
jgi:hypothetical protein